MAECIVLCLRERKIGMVGGLRWCRRPVMRASNASPAFPQCGRHAGAETWPQREEVFADHRNGRSSPDEPARLWIFHRRMWMFLSSQHSQHGCIKRGALHRSRVDYAVGGGGRCWGRDGGGGGGGPVRRRRGVGCGGEGGGGGGRGGGGVGGWWGVRGEGWGGGGAGGGWGGGGGGGVGLFFERECSRQNSSMPTGPANLLEATRRPQPGRGSGAFLRTIRRRRALSGSGNSDCGVMEAFQNPNVQVRARFGWPGNWCRKSVVIPAIRPGMGSEALCRMDDRAGWLSRRGMRSEEARDLQQAPLDA